MYVYQPPGIASNKQQGTHKRQQGGRGSVCEHQQASSTVSPHRHSHHSWSARFKAFLCGRRTIACRTVSCILILMYRTKSQYANQQTDSLKTTADEANQAQHATSGPTCKAGTPTADTSSRLVPEISMCVYRIIRCVCLHHAPLECAFQCVIIHNLNTNNDGCRTTTTTAVKKRGTCKCVSCLLCAIKRKRNTNSTQRATTRPARPSPIWAHTYPSGCCCLAETRMREAVLPQAAIPSKNTGAACPCVHGVRINVCGVNRSTGCGVYRRAHTPSWTPIPSWAGAIYSTDVAKRARVQHGVVLWRCKIAGGEHCTHPVVRAHVRMGGGCV